MLFSQNIYVKVSGDVEKNTDFVLSAVVSRPVFDSSDPQPVVGRDSENYQGAIIIADQTKNVTNVTVWYSLSGGDNTTIPLLFGDDGGHELSWTTPISMVYDEVKSNNSATAYYNYTFQIQSDFIIFRAWYDEYEDDIGIPNIITTGVRIESSFLQSYYTQYDTVDMNISLFNYNISKYGLEFRKVTPDYDEEFLNSTFTFTDNGTFRDVIANFNHSFEVDTQIEVRAFIVHFDNFTKTDRILYENKAHILTLIEGTPEIELESEPFTNDLNISLTWNATPVKGEVTAVNIDWGDETNEDLTNLTVHKIYHLYSEAKEYNITVTVEAGAAVGSETISILIDQTAPTVNISYIDPDENPDDGNITINGPKQVTITFTSHDEGGSGVAKIVIETDEGNVYELLEVNGSYTVEFLEYGYHTVTVTVYDNAGNTFKDSISFYLSKAEEPTDIGVPVSTVAIIVGVLSLTFLKRKKH